MNKAAQEYLDAAARVAEMDDDELGRWYAKAVRDYTSLALWSRKNHLGSTGAAANAMREEWRDAAAELYIAIDNRIDGETFAPQSSRPANPLSGVALVADVFRRGL